MGTWGEIQDQLARGNQPGLASSLVGQGSAAGAFSPYGSPALLDAISKMLMRQQQGGQQEARMRAILGNPNDPTAAAWAGQEAGIQGQTGMANQLADAWARSIQGNQNFLQQGVLAPYLQSQYNTQAMKLAHDLWGQNNQGFFGQLLGGAGGALGQAGGSGIMDLLSSLFSSGGGIDWAAMFPKLLPAVAG